MTYCFVCNRPTDHFAEHEGLVHAGLAAYAGDSVVRTDAWDDTLAAAISQAEFEAYCVAADAGHPLDYDLDAVLVTARQRVAAAAHAAAVHTERRAARIEAERLDREEFDAALTRD